MASAARTRLAGAVQSAAPLWVFALLPSAGLVNGALYAPLLFGLAILVALALWASGRTPVRADGALLVLGGLFVALGWASIVWSVAPAESARRALQLTLIAAASLLLLHLPTPEEGTARKLFPVMLAALVVGALTMEADRALGYKLQHLLASQAPFPVTKYNRGLDYLAVLAWPMLACGVAARRGRQEVALAVLLAVLLALAGHSATAPLALLCGALGYGLAMIWPRQVERPAAGAVTLMVVTLPVWLRVVAEHRELLARHVKESGMHRLEIWDYMTARVMERPVLGWGLAAAHAVPIRPAELAQYQFVVPQGIYPHQQWLELWLELGLVGAALALALAMLVLRRIALLPPRTRPFAFAAFAAALAVSFSNFEITTDSWWGALAGTAFLIRTAARLEAA